MLYNASLKYILKIKKDALQSLQKELNKLLAIAPQNQTEVKKLIHF